MAKSNGAVKGKKKSSAKKKTTKKKTTKKTSAKKTTKKKTTKKGRKKKVGVAAISPLRDDERTVVYPKKSAKLYAAEESCGMFTQELAKKLLGWEEESGKIKFGQDYLIKDAHGKKIRCNNDIINRPLNAGVILTLKQEILRGNWEYNGETVIIGNTGQVLNGQHQMIALVLACQEVEKHPARWPSWTLDMPALEKLVAFGVSEKDKVVNTMDTAKPRSLWEAICRSDMFADIPLRGRKAVSRYCENAVRLLWERTGAVLDAYAPRRTHSESLSFIERHPKLLECCKVIYELEQGAKTPVKFFITGGYAAGLFYLMGSAATDPGDYQEAISPNESFLDWELWDKACSFWTELTQDKPSLAPVRSVFKRIYNDPEAGNIPRAVKLAILVRAWLPYASELPVASKDLSLEYVTDEYGHKKLLDYPTVGGIDLFDQDEEDIDEDDPTLEEIEERKEALRKKKASRKSQYRKQVGSMQGDEWGPGDTCWVSDPSGGSEPYFATVTTDPWESAVGPLVMVKCSEGVFEEPTGNLTLEDPSAEAA